jgi:xylose isomerase
MDGVWLSASANTELYLTLRDRARAFRVDPEVKDAVQQAGKMSEQPHLSEVETYEQLLADRPAFQDYNLEPPRIQGYNPPASSGLQCNTSSVSTDRQSHD